MKEYYFSETEKPTRDHQLACPSGRKGVYKKPALVRYGLVSKLTQAGSNGGVENGGYNMMGVYVLMGMMGMG